MLKLTSFEHDDNKFEFQYRYSNEDIDNITELIKSLENNVTNNIEQLGYSKLKFGNWNIYMNQYAGDLSSSIKYNKEDWVVELYLAEPNKINITIVKDMRVAVGRALRIIADRLKSIS